VHDAIFTTSTEDPEAELLPTVAGIDSDQERVINNVSRLYPGGVWIGIVETTTTTTTTTMLCGLVQSRRYLLRVDRECASITLGGGPSLYPGRPSPWLHI
ncbi:hypothetical protein V1478_018648, partial [Vespula squamosa]